MAGDVVSLLAVAAGGAVGAVSRYLVDRAIQSRHGSLFPVGTFVVNVVGSLLLGCLLGGGISAGSVWMALFGVGMCGALTTYSTFSAECFRLAEEGRWVLATVNALGSVLASILAAACGFVLVQGVVGGAG